MNMTPQRLQLLITYLRNLADEMNRKPVGMISFQDVGYDLQAIGLVLLGESAVSLEDVLKQ